MISSARQRRLVHALEEIVGGDLALVGVHRRAQPSTAAGQSAAGSLLASEPPIVPMLRTCRSPMPSASAASAGIAALHVRRRGDFGMPRHRADDERVAVLADALELGDARRDRRACPAARAAASSRRRGSARRRVSCRRSCASAQRRRRRDFGLAVVRMRTCDVSLGVGRACWIAFHTRCGDAGMSRCLTPTGASASCTAFIIAAGAPMAPASPQPLAPSGLCVHGVTLRADLERRHVVGARHRVVHVAAGQQLAAVVS